MTVAEHSQLVAALLGVPGVAAAAIESTDDGPGTLRLQLAPGVDEVGVAGEVNHLLRTRFGLAVDTDRVRVVGETDGVDPAPTAPAGADEDPAARPAGAGAAAEPVADTVPAATTRDGRDRRDAPASLPPTVELLPPSRVVIERVQLVSAGLATSVVVTMSAGGRSVQGTAEGTATTGSLNRAVAAATLRAVEAVVEGRARFDVDHVEVAETGAHRTALAVVTMVTDRATQRLSGASVVREDARQAVIRAVLAAVNRRLGPLLAP